MDFRLLAAEATDLFSHATDALVLVLPAQRTDWALDKTLDGLAADALKQGDLELKAGRSVLLHRAAGLKAPRLLLVVAADGSVKAWRAAVAAAAAVLKGGGAKTATLAWGGAAALEAAHAEAAVQALEDAVYVYRTTKPSAPAAAVLRTVSLAAPKAAHAALRPGLVRGQAVAAGVALARENANRPGNHCTPTHLAEQARALGKSHGLKVEVLDQKAVEKLGMGSFLAVAKGSDEPLKFIVMHYEGATKKDAPVVLVGKGITFDTGGISLKPAAEMDEMKFDMGGAASVLGN